MASISCPDVAQSWIIRHVGHLDPKILDLVLRDHEQSDREPQTILLYSDAFQRRGNAFPDVSLWLRSMQGNTSS
jgi:hypothetical protein